VGPLGTDASTGPSSTLEEELVFPLRSNEASPSPIPVPPPRARVRQIAIRGRGTQPHPYWVGFHKSPHRVSEGVGCHRRDRGRWMVAGGFPTRDPSVAVNSDAGAPL
jgi:hypothetical protein